MTITETYPAILVEWEAAALHLACCQADRFFCGAPFHPEAEATAHHSEDEACERCVDIRYEMLCPADQPTHQHCPFTKARCP